MESKYSYQLSYRSKTEWNKKIFAFTPGKNNISTHLEAAGSANEKFTLNECFYDSEIKTLKS